MPGFRSSQDPLSEDEWPDEQDAPEDDDIEVIRCANCGAMIAEDSPQCPHCRTWGPGEAAQRGPAGLRRAALILLVVLLIGVILVMWHGLGR